MLRALGETIGGRKHIRNPAEILPAGLGRIFWQKR
jgi:hypothetical protein